jgi:acetolactate synthase-1/2/3 large subunit
MHERHDSRVGDDSSRSLLPRRPHHVRAADHIAELLLSHGVETVFGLPGGAIAPVFDALGAAGLELVINQHEVMAIYAAAGYARVTGKPGVAVVTAGPGALNTLTGLASVARDESPVLVLAGEANERNFGRSPLQDGTVSGLNLMSMVQPVTKYAELVLRAERATAAIEHALSVIARQPHGAAFVSLPFNLTRSEILPLQRRAQTPEASRPDNEICREIAEMLGKAHESRARWALMLGIGAKRAGVAPLVFELAQRLQIPVCTDLEGKGVFPENDPLSLGVFGIGHRGPAHGYFAEPVDLLFTIGCRFDDTTTLGYADFIHRDRGQFIQLDHDQARLARSYAPNLAVCADLRETLRGVLSALPSTRCRREAGDVRLRPAPAVELVNLDSSAPHDPRRIAPALKRVFGPDVALCCDVGNHMVFTAQTLAVEHPEGFWVSHGLGSMGSGIGAAIGMQLAYGDSRQVVCVCGDGGILMHGCELATCARYSIPLITVVFNDRRLGMVDHGFRGLFGRTPDFSTPAIDLVQFGRSIGLRTERLEELADLRQIVDRHQGQPLLIDVPIDPQVSTGNPRVDILTNRRNEATS